MSRSSCRRDRSGDRSRKSRRHALVVARAESRHEARCDRSNGRRNGCYSYGVRKRRSWGPPGLRYLEHTSLNASLFMTAPRVAARTFQDLVVWRKAHELVLAVYSFTAGFPKTETYGLALQMRRAAVSVPANMAEGSLEESRYYLILAKDLGYGDTGSLTTLLEEVSRLLNAYASAILASDLTADFHIPQGYQGRSPCLVRTFGSGSERRAVCCGALASRATDSCRNGDAASRRDRGCCCPDRTWGDKLQRRTLG